jgi:hypothetical protein
MKPYGRTSSRTLRGGVAVDEELGEGLTGQADDRWLRQAELDLLWWAERDAVRNFRDLPNSSSGGCLRGWIIQHL